jgi:hypothetical protein
MQNALYFNKQDRLFVNAKDSSESVKTKVNQLFDLLLVRVSFPLHFKPPQVWAEVYDAEKNLDRGEQAHAAARLTTFEDDNSVILTLEKPLPGYTYKIAWELPESEVEQMNVKDSDRNFAEGINERLLLLRTDRDTYRRNQIEQKLYHLRSLINGGIGKLPIGAEDLEISLHCLDAKNGRLECAVYIGEQSPHPPITIGDTVVGQAYKRREVVVYSPQKGLVDGPGLDDYDGGHTGILSIPLFYPIDDGLRVGVVTLATRSKTASFLRLLDADLSPEDESAFSVIVDQVLDWYGESLIPALGLR